MVGMINLHVDTPGGASRLFTDGAIVLKQDKPVLIDSITRNLYNINPLTDGKIE